MSADKSAHDRFSCVNDAFLAVVGRIRAGGVSVNDLASTLGVSRQCLYLILQGKRRASVELLERSCAVHGVSVWVEMGRAVSGSNGGGGAV